MSRDNTSRQVVLFIHGIVGNDRIFDFLKPYVPADCEARFVTLAGHGGDALDFSRASMADWRKQVSDELSALRRSRSRVMLAAHSMGCLFAISEALKGGVDTMLLLNPPLSVRLTRRFFINNLKVAFGRIHSDKYTTAALNAYGIKLDYNPLHYYGWPMRYLELFAEIRHLRKLLEDKKILSSTQAFLSAADEMVSLKSQVYLANQLTVRVAILPESGHYYYSESDKERVADVFKSLLPLG